MTVGEDIEAVLSGYADALRAGDVGAAVECFTADAAVMAPAVPTADGSAVRELYRQIFGALRLDIRFTVDAVVDGDEPVAFTHSDGTQTDQSSGRSSAEANREAFLFRRDGRVLKIHRYLFNTVA